MAKRLTRRERNRREHLRIAAEQEETYRAHFENWGAAGAEYRRMVRAALLAHADVDAEYQQGRSRLPSPLTLDELGVVLAAVDGFGESNGGLSYARILTAFAVIGVGKQRSKASACLRTLAALGLIEPCGRYQLRKRGNQYRLTGPALTALGRAERGAADVPIF